MKSLSPAEGPHFLEGVVERSPPPPPPIPAVQTRHKEWQEASMEEEAGVSLQRVSNPDKSLDWALLWAEVVLAQEEGGVQGQAVLPRERAVSQG